MPSSLLERSDLDSHIMEKTAQLPTFPQEAPALKYNGRSLPADQIYCSWSDSQVDFNSNRIEHDTL